MPYDGVAEDKQCQDLTSLYGALQKTVDFFEGGGGWIKKRLFVSSDRSQGGCYIGMLCNFLGIELPTNSLEGGGAAYERFNRLAYRIGGMSFSGMARFNDKPDTKIEDVIKDARRFSANVVTAISNGLPEQKIDHAEHVFESSTYLVNWSLDPTLVVNGGGGGKITPVEITQLKEAMVKEAWEIISMVEQQKGLKFDILKPMKEYAST